MAKSDLIELEGTVTDAFKGGIFEVSLTVGEGENTVEQKIRATISGKLRKNYIKILRGDRVTVRVSPYDLKNGIITWRFK